KPKRGEEKEEGMERREAPRISPTSTHSYLVIFLSTRVRRRAEELGRRKEGATCTNMYVCREHDREQVSGKHWCGCFLFGLATVSRSYDKSRRCVDVGGVHGTPRGCK